MSNEFVGNTSCFWCGGMKDILFHKRLGKAPKNVIIDYDFCNECLKQNELGTRIIEVSTEPTKRAEIEIQKGLYPTGYSWVIKSEASKEIFERDDKIIMIDEEVAKDIGLKNEDKQ